MRNNTYIKTVKRLLFLAIVFLVTISAMGQVNMTKIKDGTKSNTDRIPVKGAILELESLNKGFLTPRMTTGQRDAIPIENRAHGLLIFNTNTGCFNYWDIKEGDTEASKWLSICGTPPPAVFHINESQCSTVSVSGSYKQGEYFSDANFIVVGVTVTQAGTYNVLAETTPANGYYFSAEGTFPTSGNYTLILHGRGTPGIGHENNDLGDSVKFSLNNKQSTCDNVYIKVTKAEVKYKINCALIKAEGEYYIGLDLTKDNKLKVPVNVTTTGFWTISTNEVNGIEFNGSGVFDATGPTVVFLNGSGKPTSAGENTYTLFGNSHIASDSKCENVKVKVKDVSLEVKCDELLVNGNYMQDVVLNSSNNISLPINVIATGKSKFTTNEVDGISFTTGQDVSFSALGERTIALVAVGTPTSPGTKTFTIQATNGLNSDATSCTFDVEVAAQPVSYSMTCSSIDLTGKYAPKIKMNDNNTMIISVNVDYIGSYVVKTNELNGVYFEGSGTFTSTGIQEIVLKAVGTPITGGNFNYEITSNTTSGNNTCTKNVLYIYRKMNLLGLGAGVYSPGTAPADHAAKYIPLSTSNFSPNGTFKSEGFEIFNGDYSQGAFLSNLINSKKIDVIIIAFNYIPDASSITVLNDFVKNKKGVLVHSQENDPGSAKNLIDTISGGSVTVTGVGPTVLNPILNVDDPTINGHFKDLRGLLAGNDVNNAYYISSGVPSNMASLIKNNVNSSIWMIKHNSLAYIYIGDSGWLSGNTGQFGWDIYPAHIDQNGKPLSRPYLGGESIYNSYLYANILAWAIIYAQENTDVDYQVL